ncbi:MAG: clan AA aspartic protease [Lacipirellulaceae bacterium]
MGATHVTVAIRNPAEPGRVWEALFLVDTEAIDSLVPRDALESIGLKPKGKRVYELADDGSELTVDATTADVEFMGEIVGGTIIMGEPGVEPLLGVTALESVGIEVDPRSQRLKRLPSVRLKRIRPVSRGLLVGEPRA